MIVEFFEPCIPPRTGSKTNYRAVTSKATGKTHVFKGEGATASMATWHEILKPHAPEKPLEGACKLTVRLFFPLIGSDTSTKAKKAETDAGFEPWMTTRPDLGNLTEAIQDVMTKLCYFRDDSQIVMLRQEKKRSNQPGVYIRLEELQ